MTTPGHLDDEALSALLDGEGLDVDDHTRSCARCEDRLASLRSVSLAVGAAPALDDGTRGTVIARALRDLPVPLQSRRRRPDRRLLPLLAAAAAIVIALGAGVTLAGRNDGSSVDEPLAASTDDRGASPEIASAAAAPVDGGNLGEIADGAALREVVALRGFGPAPEAAVNDQGNPNRAAVSAQMVCEAEGAALAPSAGAQSYRAVATIKGRPAMVYGFGEPGEQPTVLLALDAGTCEVVLFSRDDG